MNDCAICVKDVSKIYKLYDKRADRIVDALGFSHKKRYKEHHALKNVSFEVKKGETIGIIGTNGSGKSTILKIITGIVTPTGGEVKIEGRISALLELGAGFNMEYTGIENVYLNGSMIGFTKEEIDSRLDAILEFADIGEFVYQPVKTYSSGMFVRLAFAVAINIDPEILIVDEALSVGDVFFQNKCYKKFEEFKQLGKTIIFVSHDLGSINRYCDRVILLNKGDKIAEGNPKEMINLYKKILAKPAEKISVQEISKDGRETGSWRSHYELNPSCTEYGNGAATIIDFALVDEDGELSSSIFKGNRFQIKSKVEFHEELQNPIFTFTFKTIKGVDVTGSNTMIEKIDTGIVRRGDVMVATFEQEMYLQGGEYLLSVSCTGFDAAGEFQVYHRLYDVCSVTVISDKDTVGFYDMNSTTTVERL
ncbi:MAG: ABC transporter ATP-binding protein [Lachnospiraceae bacterium]|jgi:teichoic acid transport system ATP-binding protein|nr:ABC transporter ATP-binding protein [Lachnospiraceae bacterium]